MLLLRLSIALSLLGLTGYGATFGTVTAALGAADMVLDQSRPGDGEGGGGGVGREAAKPPMRKGAGKPMQSPPGERSNGTGGGGSLGVFGGANPRRIADCATAGQIGARHA